MHSGNLPGYPASHGCIRMPYDFSMLLFGITGSGGTVVIGDETDPQPHFAENPGVMLAPKDFTPEMLKPLAKGEYQWHPERSTKGPAQHRPIHGTWPPVDRSNQPSPELSTDLWTE